MIGLTVYIYIYIVYIYISQHVPPYQQKHIMFHPPFRDTLEL